MNTLKLRGNVVAIMQLASNAKSAMDERLRNYKDALEFLACMSA